MGRLRPAVLGAAAIGLSACTTEALPREPIEGDASARDGTTDARDDRWSDATPSDVRDASPVDRSVDDALGDMTTGTDVSDVAVDIADATADANVNDAIVGDAIDATTVDAAVDASDTGTSVDASDTGADAADTAADTADAPPSADANDAGPPIDASDASDAGADVSDSTVSDGVSPDVREGGGLLVLYEENFNSGLGSFVASNVCGTTPPVWSNVGPGYAHVSEPATGNTGAVSRIYSPAIEVPANTSNVRLRMRHRFDIEDGWDGAQLVISKNGATPTMVTTFTTGGYNGYQHPNPETCSLSNPIPPSTPNQYPAWTGNQAEFESEVNLSAAPFSVVPGNTIAIYFRMSVDAATTGNGWDINWVRLTANSP